MQTQNIDPRQIDFDRNVRDELTNLDELAASIEQRGLLQFPRVRKAEGGRFVAKTGHRRIEACRRLGMKEIPCVVVDGENTTLEQIVENLQRDDLTWGETGRALIRAQAETGLSGAKLAHAIGKSEGTFSKHTTVQQALPPEVLAKLEAAGVAFSTAYAIATASPDKQAELIASALNGASRDAIAGAVKQGKNKPEKPDKPDDDDRVRRLVCRLPGDDSVTISGKKLDIDRLIKLLEDVLGVARRSRTQGLSVATLGRAFRDMATDKAKAP